MSSSAERATHHRHLTAAAELVNRHLAGEPASAHLVAHVRLADVADHLGVARSSLYRAWPTQQEFWHDLVVFCTASPIEAVTSLCDPLHSTHESAVAAPLDLLRQRFIDAEQRLVHDTGSALRSGLAGYPPGGALTTAVAAVERAERALVARGLRWVLAELGRRPVAPLEVDHLVTAMVMMLDGLVLMTRSEPSLLDRRVTLDDGGTWSMSGLAARVLLSELTEPVGPADPPSPPGSPAAPTAPLDLPEWSPRQHAALVAGRQLLGAALVAPDDDWDPLEHALGHVTLDRAARHLGITRRQMYNLWPTQAEFRRDLITHLRDEERRDYLDRLDEAIDPALLTDPDRFVLRVVDAINEYRLTDAPDAKPSLALQPHSRHPEIIAASRRWFERTLARHRELIDGLLEVSGRRPVTGVTAEDLAVLVLMGSAGSERLHRTDPGALAYGLAWRGGRHSLYAIVNQAVADHLVPA